MLSSDAHYGCPACRKYCAVTKVGVSACCGAKPDPSVTTILSIISKPALIPWAVKMEREAIREVFLDWLTRLEGNIWENWKPEEIWEFILDATEAKKAADKAKQKAAEIGTAAHALIEWFTKRELGLPVSVDPPAAPDAAQWAFMAWQDWARKVNFKPVESELVVYSTQHGYIGTADTVAFVENELTLCDYKTGKKIYREAILQNVAYKQGYFEATGVWPAGLVLRLPKVETDPHFDGEPMWVRDGPEALPAFLGAKQLWGWMRE